MRPPKGEGAPKGHISRLFLRLQLLSLSLFGVVWAALAGPQSLAEAPVVSVGRQVNSGASFTIAQLEAMMVREPWSFIASFCSAELHRGRLLIAARLADLVTQGGTDLAEMDRALERLNSAAREALACSPHDGYAWLALYWTTGRREGFYGRAFDYLAMSYKAAPREGWIAIRRNPQAVMAFQSLPAPLRREAASEWGELVKAQLYEAAAASLTQMAEVYRPQLFDQRAIVGEREWTTMSRFLYGRGSDIILPGAPLLPQRPWR